MSLGITSTSSAIVLNSVNDTQNTTNTLQQVLATNKKVLNPAQQGIVTRLSSQVNGFAAAQTNIAKYQNVLGVTATGLTSIANLITQLQTIANSSNDPSVTTATAATNQKTFAALIKQIDSLSKSSQIDGVGLMGTASTDIAVQSGLSATDTTTLSAVPSDSTTLAIDTLDVSTQAGAATAIAALSTALGTVAASQASIASNQLSLTNTAALDTSISQSLTNTIDNIQQPNAQELQQQLTKLSTQQSINYWLLNQMNQQSQNVLTLFR